jgi:hypothetical protein
MLMRRYGSLVRHGLRRSRTSRDDDEYLFRSPANAERLIRAYNDSVAGRGERFTMGQLRAELAVALGG